MSSEIEILIIFGGFLICWLEPGCWPSQSPWGRLCPEVMGKARRSVTGDRGWVWRNSSLQSGWCYPLISHRWFSQSFLCCLVTLLLKPLPRSCTLGLSYSMDMMSFPPACHPHLFWDSLPPWCPIPPELPGRQRSSLGGLPFLARGPRVWHLQLSLCPSLPWPSLH